MFNQPFEQKLKPGITWLKADHIFWDDFERTIIDEVDWSTDKVYVGRRNPVFLASANLRNSVLGTVQSYAIDIGVNASVCSFFSRSLCLSLR